jgi:hypothetical protein
LATHDASLQYYADLSRPRPAQSIGSRQPSSVTAWECRHGMTREGYEQRHALLIDRGFRRVALQTFTDATGSVRHQVTWLKFR